jgi:hypothetical protein
MNNKRKMKKIKIKKKEKKMWYLYPMEYYSAIKNEIMSFAGNINETGDHHTK